MAGRCGNSAADWLKRNQALTDIKNQTRTDISVLGIDLETDEKPIESCTESLAPAKSVPKLYDDPSDRSSVEERIIGRFE